MVVKALLVLIIPAAAFGVLASPVSLVLRRRRATGVEREQIKWLAWAGAVAGVVVVVGSAGYDVWGEELANGAILVSVLALPVVTGIAILRYRLYDIDVVINRTLVYGALTATLAVAYLGSVLLLQLALGGPHRRLRAWRWPPRRWRWRRCSARPGRGSSAGWTGASTAAATTRSGRSRRLGARLRDEVDLGTLERELRAVVARDAAAGARVAVAARGPER